MKIFEKFLAEQTDGGKNMGFVHGAHLNYSEDVPLSNLFVTISNQLGQPVDHFADSTADITDVIG